MLSNFELLVNSGYNIAYIAIYNQDGSFRNRQSVGANPLIAEDPNSFYKVVIFKGNQPDKNIIRPSENIVADFKSGIYKTFDTIIEGDVDNEKSARHAAQQVTTSIISKLPDEEDLTIELDGKTQVMKFANRSAQVKNDKVSSLGYVVLRKNKSFAEQVKGHKNTIFEVRYNFDLGGVFGDTYNTAGAVIPENCVLKFNGGKISNGSIFAYRTRIDANPVEIFDNVTFIGNIYAKNLYIEWWGGLGDMATHNNVNAMHEALNARISGDIQLLPKRYYFAGVHPDDVTFESKGNTYTNEGFSILMKGSKTIKGYQKKTIITTARTENDNAVDNSLILMINNNNIVKDIIVEGNSAIDIQDKTSIGIQMGIFVFNDTETIVDEATGVKYGEFEDAKSAYAINGGVTNVRCNYCWSRNSGMRCCQRTC